MNPSKQSASDHVTSFPRVFGIFSSDRASTSDLWASA